MIKNKKHINPSDYIKKYRRGGLIPLFQGGDEYDPLYNDYDPMDPFSPRNMKMIEMILQYDPNFVIPFDPGTNNHIPPDVLDRLKNKFDQTRPHGPRVLPVDTVPAKLQYGSEMDPGMYDPNQNIYIQDWDTDPNVQLYDESLDTEDTSSNENTTDENVTDDGTIIDENELQCQMCDNGFPINVAPVDGRCPEGSMIDDGNTNPCDAEPKTEDEVQDETITRTTTDGTKAPGWHTPDPYDIGPYGEAGDLFHLAGTIHGMGTDLGLWDPGFRSRETTTTTTTQPGEEPVMEQETEELVCQMCDGGYPVNVASVDGACPPGSTPDDGTNPCDKTEDDPVDSNEEKIEQNTEEKTFDEAFAEARSQGLEEFTWKGKKYNTKLKEEVEENTLSQDDTGYTDYSFGQFADNFQTYDPTMQEALDTGSFSDARYGKELDKAGWGWAGDVWDGIKGAAKAVHSATPVGLITNTAIDIKKDWDEGNIKNTKDLISRGTNKFLDNTQQGLQVAGNIPGAGDFLDLANAGISGTRGYFEKDPVKKAQYNIDAATNLSSATPFAGTVIGGAATLDMVTGNKVQKKLAQDYVNRTSPSPVAQTEGRYGKELSRFIKFYQGGGGTDENEYEQNKRQQDAANLADNLQFQGPNTNYLAGMNSNPNATDQPFIGPKLPNLDPDGDGINTGIDATPEGFDPNFIGPQPQPKPDLDPDNDGINTGIDADPFNAYQDSSETTTEPSETSVETTGGDEEEQEDGDIACQICDNGYPMNVAPVDGKCPEGSVPDDGSDPCAGQQEAKDETQEETTEETTTEKEKRQIKPFRAAIKAAEFVNAWSRKRADRKAKRLATRRKTSDYIYGDTANKKENRGQYDPNTGMQKPNEQVFSRQGKYGKELQKYLQSGGPAPLEADYNFINAGGCKGGGCAGDPYKDAGASAFVGVEGSNLNDALLQGGLKAHVGKTSKSGLGYNLSGEAGAQTNLMAATEGAMNPELFYKGKLSAGYTGTPMTLGQAIYPGANVGGYGEYDSNSGVNLGIEGGYGPVSIKGGYNVDTGSPFLGAGLNLKFKDGSEVELDNNTIIELIAAGADIEIL
jgi:hypothetical protein